jgi:hypothetical protein
VDDVALAVPLVGIERTKELATALAIRASLGVCTPRVARGEALQYKRCDDSPSIIALSPSRSADHDRLLRVSAPFFRKS